MTAGRHRNNLFTAIAHAYTMFQRISQNKFLNVPGVCLQFHQMIFDILELVEVDSQLTISY